MNAVRHETCTRCHASKPITEFSRRARNTHRACRKEWCKDCDRAAKDAYKRPERLAEIEQIKHLLALDRRDPDRIEAEPRYAWFRRKAEADPRFTYIEAQSPMENRLRWLKQRTQTGDTDGR